MRLETRNIPPAATRPVTEAVCEHCGTRFKGTHGKSRFCCTGCEYAAGLIAKSGLEQYYQLKERVTAPVGSAAFQTRDHTWLREALEKASAGGGHSAELLTDVQGISCIGCVWLIERIFLRSPGALRIEVHVQTGRARLLVDPAKFDAPAFAKELQGFGYLLGPPGEKPDTTESARLAHRIGLCAALMMNVMLFMSPFWFGMAWDAEYARLFRWIALLLATLSLVVGGTHFLRRAWEGLRQGVLHIDLPIALGILTAYAGSVYGFIIGSVDLLYFDFVASFIFLMLAGRWVQTYAVERNRQRLLGRSAQPDSVRLAGDPSGQSTSLGQLKPGDRYQLPPGRLVPVESRLAEDEAVFSLEFISGEADSKLYRRDNYIPAGAAPLGNRDLCLVAGEPWERSLLRRLTQPAREEEFRNLLLERVIRYYMPAILLFSAVGGIVWWRQTGDAERALGVAVAVLVISCPCALGVTAPLCDELAVARLRKRGVYVKTPTLWARLRNLRRVVFDKTGTLTLEHPELEDPATLAKLPDDALSALVRLVETSAHPISRSLHEESLVVASERNLTLPGFAVAEVIGAGLEGGGWRLGRPEWACPGVAATGTVLAKEGRPLASFHFRDLLRPDAPAEVERLRRRGLGLFILSGDREEKVQQTARLLGLPKEAALASLTPDQKAAWIEDRDAGDTLMLGDGANDSLAFEKATCRGTPIVHRGLLEQRADFYYLGKGIDGIRHLLETADLRHRTIRKVFALSLGYNVCSVTAALAGWINPLIAALLMPSISVLTLLVAASAFRQPDSISPR